MIWMDVDAALAKVPVNDFPLVDADLAILPSVAYNAAGLTLVWNFVTAAGVQTQTAVTPTNTGDYLWTNQGNGIYAIQMPASGGGTINNATEGHGWFSGVATGILPWRGPEIGFRAAGLNDLLIESAFSTTRGLAGTALPNAAAEAAGGLYTRGTGAGQINQAANGQADSNTTTWGGTAVASALVRGNVIQWTGTNVTTPDTAGSPKVTVTGGTGTGQISLSSGTVTVGTNNDKTGYTASTVSDKTGYSLSAGGVQAIWDALTSALTTVGSIGKLLVDNINATISSRLASASYTAPPTVGQIADQVWEETLADHSGTSGSTAAALNAAGSAGDPWNTALPGAYGSGTAGKIIGDNINATVSSRATPAQVATELGTYDAPTKAELDAAVAPLATAANLATVDTVVDGVATTLGVAGAGLTALGDTRIANLDATVSSRATPAQVNTEADTALSDVGLTTTITGRIDAAVSSRLASAGYTAPPSAATNASAVRTELGVELARVDAAVSTRATPVQVNAEVVDALATDTYPEPSAPPAATASLKDKIGWNAALARNKVTQTATTQTLRNDADSGNIGTSTVSDDGTTFTKNEWA
jgi:hypothetical protein